MVRALWRGDRIDIPGRPSERGYFEPPEQLYFADLMRTWAVGIARCLVACDRRERGRYTSPTSPSLLFDECWVGEDCAIYVRYRHVGYLLGVRFAELDVDMLTGHPHKHGRRDDVGGSSGAYAMNIHTALAEGTSTNHLVWTDALGYRWSADTPPDDWQQAVEHASRLETVLPRE